jgi:hypothetical protein
MASDDLVWLTDLLQTHEKPRGGHRRIDCADTPKLVDALVQFWGECQFLVLRAVEIYNERRPDERIVVVATDQKPGGDVHVLRLTVGGDYYAWEAVLNHVTCILNIQERGAHHASSRRFSMSSDDGATLLLDGSAFSVPAFVRRALEPWLRDVLQ